jgi:uncharacterized protein (DUF2249 family)/quercetin dioxygenase-like cupin family protein
VSIGSAGTEQHLDVRGLRKPEKHPTIFAAYAGLSVGGSLVVVNDHDPRHLHEEFEVDHAGSYRWEYLQREPGDWRIRITRLAGTSLPRLLADTRGLSAAVGTDAGGAVWTLQARERDLDANVIALPADGAIETHVGPDLDVLIHVLSGTGTLTGERGALQLGPGALVWLPRRCRRAFRAGPAGLCYLTVHQRRQALVLETGPGRREKGTCT